MCYYFEPALSDFNGSTWVKVREEVMDMLKTFEEKITYAVEKIKMLKEEKSNLDNRIEELENILKLKQQEIDKLMLEKASIKTQIEDLFNELESVELK